MLDSKVLVTCEMTERHYIAQSLREIAKDWNLDDKVVAVIHDNASNMVFASDLLEDWGDLFWTHTSAHS